MVQSKVAKGPAKTTSKAASNATTKVALTTPLRSTRSTSVDIPTTSNKKVPIDAVVDPAVVVGNTNGKKANKVSANNTAIPFISDFNVHFGEHRNAHSLILSIKSLVTLSGRPIPNKKGLLNALRTDLFQNRDVDENGLCEFPIFLF